MERPVKTPPPNLASLKRSSALKLKGPIPGMGASTSPSRSSRVSTEQGSRYAPRIAPRRSPAGHDGDRTEAASATGTSFTRQTSASETDGAGTRPTYSDVSSSETDNATDSMQRPLDHLVSQWMQARDELAAAKGAPRLRGTKPTAAAPASGSEDETETDYGDAEGDSGLAADMGLSSDPDGDGTDDGSTVDMIVGLKPYRRRAQRRDAGAAAARAATPPKPPAAGAGGSAVKEYIPSPHKSRNPVTTGRRRAAGAAAGSGYSSSGSGARSGRSKASSKGGKGARGRAAGGKGKKKGAVRREVSPTAGLGFVQDPLAVAASEERRRSPSPAVRSKSPKPSPTQERLDRAVTKLVRPVGHRVSIVEVHDALLGVMKAAALRDAYRTVTAVLADVPLASNSLPEPHNGVLEEVVGVLVSLRGAVEHQVAAAKRAIATGAVGPAEGLEADLGLGEALRILQPSPANSSASSTAPSPAPPSVSGGAASGAGSPVPRSASPAPTVDVDPASYLFPSAAPPVAYYGDSDFSAVNGTMEHTDSAAPSHRVDADVSIPELMARVPHQARVAFQSLRDVWAEKLRLEEAFGKAVVTEKEDVLREVWTQIQRVSALAFPLVAEARSTYTGQLTRLETLAKRDGDDQWNNTKARVDLKWHAAIRLYSAFAKHAILPRFKLNSSLPPKLSMYLRALVKGATEEERDGIDCLDDRLSDADDTDLEDEDDGDAWRKDAAHPKDDSNDTCTKRLGQFLRDPSVWWSGFHRQWKANQLTLARRFWRRCQRGEPSNDAEMLKKFKEAGKKWRRGEGDVSWSDIRSGDETQWGGARWSERVAWVHQHLFQMARDANIEWRERSSRRSVYRAINEQLRADIFGIMLFVGESICTLQQQALESLAQRALVREREFRADISRLSQEEITLAKQLEAEARTNPEVAVALRVVTRRLRPTQLTAHRRIIKTHLKALSTTVDSVGSAALRSST